MRKYFFTGVAASFALLMAGWAAQAQDATPAAAASSVSGGGVTVTRVTFTQQDAVRQVYVFDREGFDSLVMDAPAKDVAFTIAMGYVAIQDVEFFVDYHRRNPRAIIFVCRPIQENDRSFEITRTKRRLSEGCTRYNG